MSDQNECHGRSETIDRVGNTALTFDAFFATEHLALVRYATVLVGSRALAEDMVQEVLVRMYQRWSTVVEREGSVPGYARKAVTNEFLSWRRSWSTRHIRVVPDEQLDVRCASPEDTDTGDQLWDGLRSIPARQRAAIVLRFYEGYDDVEIAGVLGCAPVTVRSLISRGLRSLRSHMDSRETRGGC